MMQHKSERSNDAAAARQLDFEVGPRPRLGAVPRGRTSQSKSTSSSPEGPTILCVVCGRSRARLTLAREHGQAPVKLCLRCHHGVMQQRKMLRAGLPSTTVSVARPSVSAGPVDGAFRKHQVVGDAGLIVPREARFDGDAKYDVLTRSRRRAQVAARRALESDGDLQPAQGPNLIDLAS